MLHSNHDTSVLVPTQQGILPIPSLRVFNKGPSFEKVLVGHDASQLASDGAVNVFHDSKIGWEQNVKEALVDLEGVC